MATELRVALCAIMKNEADYVEEWLAFHILQGVSRVLLYDNNSSDDTSRARSFAPHVAVRVVPWSGPPDKFDLTQRLAYADGARRLAGVVDATFIDLDEFLFGSVYRPLGQVLGGFPADTAAIAVNQQVFGSASQLSAAEEVVTSRFTKAAAADHPQGTGSRPWRDPSASSDSTRSTASCSTPAPTCCPTGSPCPLAPIIRAIRTSCPRARCSCTTTSQVAGGVRAEEIESRPGPQEPLYGRVLRES